MYFKARRVPKLGAVLWERVKKTHLLRAVRAGQAVSVFQRLCEKREELKGARMASYRDGIIKIRAASSSQRMEMFLRREEIMTEFRRKGIEAKEIKIIL